MVEQHSPSCLTLEPNLCSLSLPPFWWSQAWGTWRFPPLRSRNELFEVLVKLTDLLPFRNLAHSACTDLWKRKTGLFLLLSKLNRLLTQLHACLLMLSLVGAPRKTGNQITCTPPPPVLPPTLSSWLLTKRTRFSGRRPSRCGWDPESTSG